MAYVRAPAASAAGSEAKALNADAQKVLAGEIEARATRISQASNDQIVLATDGVLRWTGDLVGKLVAGDDTLRPRVRVIADEHLTGPARELVQTRLDLWLKTHIEKLLAPLFCLTAAHAVIGLARGVAFQLVEALGVLERQKVAEEVKGLDQPARATLRKYGVRFGAYHIYLPALLKPAPRSLATQLWAIKHESPDAKGVGELLHLAASGRTSIPIDKTRLTHFIVPRVIVFAGSALCASISWNGLRILSARHCRGAKVHRAPNPTVYSTDAAFLSPVR
jgi:ATP-dependent RNA helicase SUPV3L1/SUV3